MLEEKSTNHFAETLKLLGKDGSRNNNADIAEFRRRIKTFIDGQKWVGKPSLLSPPLCARFGWCCSGPNKLQCTTCFATLCTSLPPMEKSTYEICISEVINSLKSAHRKNCPWPLAPCPENFYQIFPVGKKSAFQDFTSRLETLLQIENSLPQVKDSVVEALALSDDHFKSISKLSQLSESPWVNSSILLAATGWRMVPHVGDKKYITCVDCQRTVGVWFYTSAQSNNNGNHPLKEDDEINANTSQDIILSPTIDDSPQTLNNPTNDVGSSINLSNVSAPENSDPVERSDDAELSTPSRLSINGNPDDPDAQIPSAKRRKFCVERNEPFDSLFEHRPWCMWLRRTDSMEVMETSEHSLELPILNNIALLGYKVYIQCLLKNIGSTCSSPCILSSPTREQLSKAREQLLTWSSPL